jgi:hypothetical protein
MKTNTTKPPTRGRHRKIRADTWLRRVLALGRVK